MKVVLSALGPTIAEQLAQNGLEQFGTPVDQLDRFAHAITLLHIKGLMTDSECNRARTRLVKLVKVRPVTREDAEAADRARLEAMKGAV